MSLAGGITMKKLIVIMVVVGLIMAALVGCGSQAGSLKQDSASPAGTGTLDNGSNNVKDNASPDVQSPKTGAGDSTSEPQNSSGAGKDSGNQSSQISANVVLYFSDKEAMYLVKEVRSQNAKTLTAEEKVKLCLEELIKGSNNPELRSSIPEGTKIMNVSCSKDTVNVDFSREFIDNHCKGSSETNMTLGQIILTLTEKDMGGINKVIIKVEGATVGDYNGLYDLSVPLKRSDFTQFIKK